MAFSLIIYSYLYSYIFFLYKINIFHIFDIRSVWFLTTPLKFSIFFSFFSPFLLFPFFSLLPYTTPPQSGVCTHHTPHYTTSTIYPSSKLPNDQPTIQYTTLPNQHNTTQPLYNLFKTKLFFFLYFHTTHASQPAIHYITLHYITLLSIHKLFFKNCFQKKKSIFLHYIFFV